MSEQTSPDPTKAVVPGTANASTAPLLTVEQNDPKNGHHPTEAEVVAEGLASALPEATPAPSRRGRRRVLLILLYIVVSAMICGFGAVLGYTQGPPIATALAAGGQYVSAFSEYSACFSDLENSRTLGGILARLRGPSPGPGTPTATPRARPTFDPTALLALDGTLQGISDQDVTIGLADGSTETVPFFLVNRIVTTAGREISREGVLPGDLVKVLAFRMEAGQGHSAVCVIVDVDP